VLLADLDTTAREDPVRAGGEILDVHGPDDRGPGDTGDEAEAQDETRREHREAPEGANELPHRKPPSREKAAEFIPALRAGAAAGLAVPALHPAWDVP
jgi:hypothetical protein